MIQRLRTFINTILLGGITVVLPLVIIIIVFKWLFSFFVGLIQPIVDSFMLRVPVPEFLAEVLVFSAIIVVCFTVGLVERTRLGHWVVDFFEAKFLVQIPGYSIVKETVKQFTDGSQAPFSKVALCKIFANETRVTAFITEEHQDGSYTVFVPTGPNPTSGNIFHLEAEYVEIVNVSIERTMKSIIACGAGSKLLIKESKKNLST